MDRRRVLRIVGLGAVSLSGCLGTESDGSETTTDDATSAIGQTKTASKKSETTSKETGTTSEKTETATGDRRTTTDGCPPAVVPADRTHEQTDYGLQLVRKNAETPAVAVVGEDWHSTLNADSMSEASETFVTDTDFEQSVVLVVQYTKSSGGHELRVTDVEIDGDAVRAELCVVATGATNDAPTANLFVRVPYSGTAPSKANVSIETPIETITVSGE